MRMIHIMTVQMNQITILRTLMVSKVFQNHTILSLLSVIISWHKFPLYIICSAEDNPLNDYPDEEPSEEEKEDGELESDNSHDESDEDDSDKSSSHSLKPEDLLFFGSGRAINMDEDANVLELDYDDSIAENDEYELDEDDSDSY